MKLMSFFKRNHNVISPINAANSAPAGNVLAELALNLISDAVVVVNGAGTITLANPAGVKLLNRNSVAEVLGFDYHLFFKFESTNGTAVADNENVLYAAIDSNQALNSTRFTLISGAAEKRIPIELTAIVAPGAEMNKIITFRDITKDLEEEGAQLDFISTASHEMRTPVASIEGYLSLALNPQTAMIDERARNYLNAAHEASKHLGALFRDLLDTTKLEDGAMKPRLAPYEMVDLVKRISEPFKIACDKKNLKFQFGSTGAITTGNNIQQIVYGFVDASFVSEIMNNLIENAVKYTPEGGSIWVNVRGDGDRVLINVTDTGIGVSADDLQHIFQKFYRSDNSQTRTIGGTGLGLYLVKQRVEALGGKVWAESAFGEGTTFYVSLPRITAEEYEKRMIAYRNAEAIKMLQSKQAQPQPQQQAQPQPQPQQVQPQVQPPQPQPQPPQPPQPQPQQQPIATNNMKGQQ